MFEKYLIGHSRGRMNEYFEATEYDGDDWVKYIGPGQDESDPMRGVVLRLKCFKDLRQLADVEEMGNGVLFVEIPPLPENDIGLIKMRFDRLIEDTSLFVDYNHRDIECKKLRSTCLGPKNTFVGLYVNSTYSSRYGLLVKSYSVTSAEAYAQSIRDIILKEKRESEDDESFLKKLRMSISSKHFISDGELARFYKDIMKQSVYHRQNAAKIIFEKCGIYLPQGQSLLYYLSQKRGKRDDYAPVQPRSSGYMMQSVMNAVGFGSDVRSSGGSITKIVSPPLAVVIPLPKQDEGIGERGYYSSDSGRKRSSGTNPGDWSCTETEQRPLGSNGTESKQKGWGRHDRQVDIEKAMGEENGRSVSYWSQSETQKTQGAGLYSTKPSMMGEGGKGVSEVLTGEELKQRENYKSALHAYFEGTKRDVKKQKDFPCVFLCAKSNSNDLLVFIDMYDKKDVYLGAPLMLEPWLGFHSYFSESLATSDIMEAVAKSKGVGAPVSIPARNRMGILEEKLETELEQTIRQRVKWMSQVNVLYHCHPSYYGDNETCRSEVKEIERSYNIGSERAIWVCLSLLPAPPFETSLELADYYNFGTREYACIPASLGTLVVQIYDNVYQEWFARLKEYGIAGNTLHFYPPTSVFINHAHPHFPSVLMLSKLPLLHDGVIFGYPKKKKLRATYKPGQVFCDLYEREATFAPPQDKRGKEDKILAGSDNDILNPFPNSEDLGEHYGEVLDGGSWLVNLEALGLILHVHQFMFCDTARFVSNVKYKPSLESIKGEKPSVVVHENDDYLTETDVESEKISKVKKEQARPAPSIRKKIQKEKEPATPIGNQSIEKQEKFIRDAVSEASRDDDDDVEEERDLVS